MISKFLFLFFRRRKLLRAVTQHIVVYQILLILFSVHKVSVSLLVLCLIVCVCVCV